MVMLSNCLILCPLFFCLQSFPTSGSFPMSRLFASDGQSVRASASVFLMNIESWFPLGLTKGNLFSLLLKGLSWVFFSTTIWKHQFFGIQPSLWTSSHISMWLLEKPWLWLYGPLSTKWCLCFFEKKKKNLFINLAASGVSCGTWDLVPWPGIKPRPPTLGALSPSR